MKRFAPLLLVALVGCAGQQQRHVGPVYSSAADPTLQCLRALPSDTTFAPLAGKVDVGPNITPPTLEMLANKSVPSEDEKRAISSYSAARQYCVKQGIAYHQQTIPANMIAVNDQGFATTQVLLAKLYSGELTYGQFNQARLDNSTKSQAAMRAIAGQMQQQQAQADAAEAERRQVAVGMALQNMQQNQLMQQQIQQQNYQTQMQQIQMNRPVTTNCQRFGNQVSCTSN